MFLAGCVRCCGPISNTKLYHLAHMVHVRVGRARRVDAVFIHRLEERGVALQLAAGLNGQKNCIIQIHQLFIEV